VLWQGFFREEEARLIPMHPGAAGRQAIGQRSAQITRRRRILKLIWRRMMKKK